MEVERDELDAPIPIWINKQVDGSHIIICTWLFISSFLIVLFNLPHTVVFVEIHTAHTNKYMLQHNLSRRMNEANSNSFQRGILTGTNRRMDSMDVIFNICEAKRQQQRHELDNAIAAAATKHARAHNSQ